MRGVVIGESGEQDVRSRWRQLQAIFARGWVQAAFSMVLGLVFVVLGCLNLVQAFQYKQQVIAEGIEARATVVAAPKTHRGYWHIEVSYPVGEATHVASLIPVGNLPRPHEGDILTVYVDPDRPGEPVAKGYNVSLGPVTDLAGMGACFGLVLFLGGGVALAFCTTSEIRQKRAQRRQRPAQRRGRYSRRCPRGGV